ncbi:MAG: aldehyde dehydrogenase family protein [Acidimicrobiales bacterium]|nr:aldehyde dehydrogenase family protein [Acidimicrobiales bacterium]
MHLAGRGRAARVYEVVAGLAQAAGHLEVGHPLAPSGGPADLGPVSVANGTELGLYDGVVTADKARGMRVGRQLRMGDVGIDTAQGDHEAPFGGFNVERGARRRQLRAPRLQRAAEHRLALLNAVPNRFPHPRMTAGMNRTLRRSRRAIGAGVLLLAAGILQLAPAEAESVEVPAVISREAYFTSPITQVTPPVLRNGFPPATACLVAGLVGVPQLCGSEVQQIVGLLGLSDGIPIPITPDGDVAQPLVVPGTTPVGMIAGQQRYASLFQLALPAIPAGEQISSFELVLKQEGLNFAIESPATRDVVLQTVAQLDDQNPQLILDAVSRALSGEVPLVTDTITGIEACPALQPWNGGDAQGASLDGIRLPDVNCQIGTTGSYDPATATWTFDLTFAAQAWTQGVDGVALANEGIVLRPVGAPNFAYGDPDVSTNWVVSLADSTAAEGLRPAVRYSTTPADAPATDVPLDLDLGNAGGSVELPSFTPGAPLDLGGVVAPPVASVSGAISARYAERDASGGKGSTPGWVWIALPLGALAAFVFAQALDASPAAARRRPGALTHLVAARAQATSDPVAPPRS